MENLFDFATKELSQDAFLRWLFESYEDPKIGHIALDLLSSMVNLKKGTNIKPEDIKDIKTFSQAEKMDIVVDFTVNGEPKILIIEDKTTSQEHSNQLIKYKGIVEEKWNVDKYKNRESFFVYYKTHTLYELEREHIKEAEWNEYPFDGIKDFWLKYENDENIIINQYAKHVIECWKKCNNQDRPKDDDADKWLGYFINTVIKQINVKCNAWAAITHYGYVCLFVKPISADEHMPYFEIRSRDCLNNKFQARILIPAKDRTYLDKVHSILKCRSEEHVFKHYEKGTNQVAYTYRKGDRFLVRVEQDFIKYTNEAIKDYLSIINELNSQTM